MCASVQVFVLSVRAAAVGITLTSANYVFFLEPLLNTALDDQAVGRAWRMGQKREVTVKRLFIKGSVEEAIMSVAKNRQVLTSLKIHSFFSADSLRASEKFNVLFLANTNRLSCSVLFRKRLVGLRPALVCFVVVCSVKMQKAQNSQRKLGVQERGEAGTSKRKAQVCLMISLPSEPSVHMGLLAYPCCSQISQDRKFEVQIRISVVPALVQENVLLLPTTAASPSLRQQ